jgi:type IV secretion system protein VirB3
MFAGVAYSYFVANAVIATEFFLVFRSLWAIGFAVVIHIVGVALSAREPRFLDLWLVRVGRCPRVRNYSMWQCNSYRA